MTTIAAPEQWGFAGTSLSSLAYFVSALDNPDDLPPLRGEDQPFGGLVGRRSLGKLFDSRRIALHIVVMPQDASGVTTGTNRVQARANLDALYQLLGVHGQQALTRLMPDGTTRTAQAECVAVTNVEDPAGGEVFAIVADFLLADPHFYGASVSDLLRSIQTPPVTWNVTHPGTVLTHHVVVTFTAPGTNPRITNNTTGTYVQITGALGAVGGATYAIDCAAFTAIDNLGADWGSSIAHAGAVPFLTFAPGVNSLTVSGTGNSSSSKVSVVLSPAYL